MQINHSDIQLCKLVQQAVERELSAPDFTTSKENTKRFRYARYIYVYLCRDVNIPFATIRGTLTVYNNDKTIYQLFRRVYLAKRKQDEYKWVLIEIRYSIDKMLNDKQNLS